MMDGKQGHNLISGSNQMPRVNTCIAMSIALIASAALPGCSKSRPQNGNTAPLSAETALHLKLECARIGKATAEEWFTRYGAGDKTTYDNDYGYSPTLNTCLWSGTTVEPHFQDSNGKITPKYSRFVVDCISEQVVLSLITFGDSPVANGPSGKVDCRTLEEFERRKAVLFGR